MDCVCYTKRMSKTDELKQIRNEVLGLTESPLYEYREENDYLPVIGQGSHDADLMFIGEAPGKNEAETGVPFCGRAGNILDELLEHIDLLRADVYIANILKDRPPENRDPTTEEIEIYTPFLVRQIQIIEPQAIATLGRFAMEFVKDHFGIDNSRTISNIHGEVLEMDDKNDRTLKFVPLFHPAVALYDPNKKDTLKEDFETLKNLVN